jgi:hypothetical protein
MTAGHPAELIPNPQSATQACKFWLDRKSRLIKISDIDGSPTKEAIMPDTKLPPWKLAYEQIRKDLDNQKLKELILAAEEAIFLRYQELANSSDHHEERREMREATHDLLNLKITKLGYPRVPNTP